MDQMKLILLVRSILPMPADVKRDFYAA